MKLICALATVAIMSASGFEAAASVSQSVAVRSGDLDLGSNKGRHILAIRIQRAAMTICKSQTLGSVPSNMRRERNCIRAARASVVAAEKTKIATSD